MKTFEEPVVEIVRLDPEDIITASSTDCGYGGNELPENNL